jgi:hypothetical protein
MPQAETEPEETEAAPTEGASESPAAAAEEAPQVVSLDAFRRRPPSKP